MQFSLVLRIKLSYEKEPTGEKIQFFQFNSTASCKPHAKTGSTKSEYKMCFFSCATAYAKSPLEYWFGLWELPGPLPAPRHTRKTSTAPPHSIPCKKLSCHTGTGLRRSCCTCTCLQCHVTRGPTLACFPMQIETLMLPQRVFLHLCTSPPGGPDLFLSHSSQISCPSAPFDLSDTLGEKKEETH